MPDPAFNRALPRTVALAATIVAVASCTATSPPRDRPEARPPAAAAPAPASQPDPAAIAAILDSVPGIDAAELEIRLGATDAPVLLDVRSAEEYAAGHIPGARNLPHDQLARRLDELAAARDQDVIVYCRTGRRAATAIDTLRRAGYTRLVHLRGDFQGWSAAGNIVAVPAGTTPAGLPAD